MNKKYRFKVDKLIRDKLPELMRSQNIEVFERELNEDEYLRKLKDKLIEEAKEAVAATNSREELLEELADLLEVMECLAKIYGLSMHSVEKRKFEKKSQKGGFDKRIYNAAVEISGDNPMITYYRARPKEYPQVD